MVKKVRSLIAAVVAVACLYTPTAVAEPTVSDDMTQDSTIQVDGDAVDLTVDDTGETQDAAPTNESPEPSGTEDPAPVDGDGQPEDANGVDGEDDGVNVPENGGVPENGNVEGEDTEAEAPQPSAQDWTDNVDNLVFSTSGLTITPNQTSPAQDGTASSTGNDDAGTSGIAGVSVIPDGLNGSGVAHGDGGAGVLGGLTESQPERRKDDAAQLPSVIGATLNLTFTLDATAGDGRADGSGLGAIVPGDHFSVPMPEGMTAADDGTTLDVFMLDADGNATTVRVGEATAGNGTLTVTFTEPTDTQTQETVAAPASVSASVDVPVTFDATLVQDEASTIAWTVRTVADAEGNQHPETLTLDVPARSELEALIGISVDDATDGETPLSEEKRNTSATNALDAAPNVVSPLSGRDGSEKKVTHSFDGNDALSLTITWCDNNYGARPATASLTGYIPQFQLDESGDWIDLLDQSGNVTGAARQAFGLTEGETLDWAKASTVNQTAVNTYVASVSGLPDSVTTTTSVPVDENGDGQQDVDEFGRPKWEQTSETTQTIRWRWSDSNSYPAEYQFGDNDDLYGENKDDKGNPLAPHRYLMLTSPVTFTVEGKIGGKNLSDIFTDKTQDFFRIGASINNEEQGTGNVASVAEREGLTISEDKTTHTATISGRLPMYDVNGDPIVYYIKYTGPSPDVENSGYTAGTDYYQVSYNNANSTNHGSATDAVYDGGTMVLRRMGVTAYDADKVWLDGGNQDQRPATTFTLWRYANNGTAGPTTASQVQLNELGSQSGEAQTNALGYVSIDVPAKSTGNVDLGTLLEQKYGGGIKNLPKYDPDGYPYVYALREEGAPAGYEIVYGSVSDDGGVTDTAPNYEKESYNDPNPGTEKLDATRSGNDPFVYNGGTITNRLTGSKVVSATKTWEIAAFQDDLQNVEITFTAQSRVKGDDASAWTDVEGTNATHTEGGWQSETLTRTFSGTFPKYNALGQELEYRWVESGVKQDGRSIDFTSDEDGGGSFQLTLPTSDGDATETLEFTSTLNRSDDEDGTDTIVNTFKNTTTEYVEKWWQQPDGSMAQIKPDPNGYAQYPDLDLSGKASFGLYQDGVLVGAFTMDGTSDKSPQPLTKKDGTVADGFDDATWQETSSYDVTLDNLPKYSPEGKRYSYVVLEDGVDGWHSERTYDAENHLTKVENTVGPGEGSEIRVMKNWIDGDDAAHRDTTVVQLVALDHIASNAQNEDGSPKYEYNAGDVVTAVYQDGQLTEDGKIVLSAGNSWFAEVDIPIGGLGYQDFKLVEVGLQQEDGTINPVVGNADEAIREYGEDTIWGNVAWNYEDTQNTSRVANEHHVYETSAGPNDEPQYNDAMRAVTASNRRIGLIDLTVSKEWKDNGDASGRPDAQLVLSCSEYPKAFSIDGNGNVWVKVSANKLPVNIPTGEGLNDRRQLNTGQDQVSLDDEGNLVMKIDSSEAGTTGTYYFYGLPKYDVNGIVVHYDVNEEWAEDSGDYVSSKSEDPYTVGPLHFHDQQSVAFTNRRTGTRDVTFYKHWNDQYVNDELHQRPDIYLTLYRVTVTGVDADGNATYSDPERVDEYVHWLWAPQDTGNPEYEQMSTIRGLEAYDGEGRAYIYYASESMAIEDTSSLDYGPVTFSYGSIEDAQQNARNEGVNYPGGENAVWVGSGEESGDPASNGTGYAIHEDGTFVNTLEGNLTANGTKLWVNVPGNVVQTADGNDLPEITVYLQRKLATDDSWPSLKFTVDNSGAWHFADDETPGAIAWTSSLKYQTNNQYSYTITHVGENGGDPDNEAGDKLARYNDEGVQYQYRAIEVTWGLLGKDGGFTKADVEKTDFSKLRDGDTDPLPGVVVISHGETGSFRLTNTYVSPKDSLTVKKLFKGRDAGDRYPDTTFEVYRYYVNEEGVVSKPDLVTSHTLTHDELNTPTTGDNANPKVTASEDGANNTAKYTFSGLDIYAPDGSYWQYFVVERPINGYTTTVGVGNLSAGEVTQAGTERTDISGTSSADLCETGTAPADGGAEQKAAPIMGTVLKDDTKPDVTFKNVYHAEKANLAGTKSWTDYNDIFGIRPSADEFKKNLTVERIGNGTTEDITDELQDGNSGGDNYFNVTGEDTSNTFAIVLNNVEKWAPDGNAWQYRITEKLSGMKVADTVTADGFYQTSSSSSTVATDTPNGFQLTNRLYGSASVRKTWEDGNNPYGLRPSTVTVRLQRALKLGRLTESGKMPISCSARWRREAPTRWMQPA